MKKKVDILKKVSLKLKSMAQLKLKKNNLVTETGISKH